MKKIFRYRDRRVGLLGYGVINSKVHKFLSGFNVKFAALKTSWDVEQDFPTSLQKFTPEELHQFLQIIDILVVALPLTQLTRDLIGQKELDINQRQICLIGKHQQRSRN